jgi:hypothetical protein
VQVRFGARLEILKRSNRGQVVGVDVERLDAVALQGYGANENANREVGA